MVVIIRLVLLLYVTYSVFSAEENKVSWSNKLSQKIIKGDLKKYSSSLNCKVEKCCELSDDHQNCSLSDFELNKSTFVLPGGSTRCIFGSPFSFQVIPGKSEKLLVYYQGGGACWDQLTTVTEPLCTTESTPQSLVGIFDRTREENAFKDYTIVMGTYCSGDIWGGDVTQPYNDRNGNPVVQTGYANGKAMLDWIKVQQNSGALASQLTNLVVMGCSAGSIGTQLWADTVLGTLKWSHAAIVPDSYAGVFPDGSEGPLIQSFGFCQTPLVSNDLKSLCVSKQLTMKMIMEKNLANVKNIPYAYIQSKVDEVQMSFYVSVGITTNTSSMITPLSFYARTNEIFGAYNLNKNFITFLVNGDHHCYTNQDLYYSTNGLGHENNDGLMLYQWINTLPLEAKSIISTECTGEVLKDTVLQTSKKIVDVTKDCTFCSSSVYPKTFIEE